MNKYHIKRVDPNTGQIWEIGPFGEEIQTTETMSYLDCKIYIMQHQTGLRVYKVGRIGTRKDAKRRMYKRIFAQDIVEAMNIFNQLTLIETSTLQLCTGDWKVIAEKKPQSETKFYL